MQRVEKEKSTVRSGWHFSSCPSRSFMFHTLTCCYDWRQEAKERLSWSSSLLWMRLHAERPMFPLGHVLERTTLMLLICDLQTLCFHSSATAPSSPPLTVCFPFSSIGFVLLLSSLPLAVPKHVCFNIFFVLPILPSLLLSILLLKRNSGRNTFSHAAWHIKCIIVCHRGRFQPLQVAHSYTKPFYFIRMPSLAHSHVCPWALHKTHFIYRRLSYTPWCSYLKYPRGLAAFCHQPKTSSQMMSFSQYHFTLP